MTSDCGIVNHTWVRVRGPCLLWAGAAPGPHREGARSQATVSHPLQIPPGRLCLKGTLNMHAACTSLRSVVVQCLRVNVQYAATLQCQASDVVVRKR